MNHLLSLSQQTFYYPVQVPAPSPESAAPSPVPPQAGQPPDDAGQAGPDKREEPENSRIPGRRSFDTYECQTCKNRKYKDGSDDPGVSFKTPTHISPENAAYAIRSHEMEHVSHARSKAQQEDQDIVSQSVTYHTAICPECGRVYVSGGTTRTVFQQTQKLYGKEPEEKGARLDMTA